MFLHFCTVGLGHAISASHLIMFFATFFATYVLKSCTVHLGRGVRPTIVFLADNSELVLSAMNL